VIVEYFGRAVAACPQACIQRGRVGAAASLLFGGALPAGACCVRCSGGLRALNNNFSTLGAGSARGPLGEARGAGEARRLIY
jgi:hypothetical protein